MISGHLILKEQMCMCVCSHTMASIHFKTCYSHRQFKNKTNIKYIYLCKIKKKKQIKLFSSLSLLNDHKALTALETNK